MFKYVDPPSLMSNGHNEFPVSSEIIVAHGNYKELRFSRFAYYMHSDVSIENNRILYATGGTANNEFNEAAISSMRAIDTLAVKAYSVVCKAQ